MNTQLLLIIFAMLGIFGYAITCVFFRFRPREALFFAALLLPNIWLSRFDSNGFHPLNLEFPTFWIILTLIIISSFFLSEIWTTQLLLRPSTITGFVILLLLLVMVTSTLFNSRSAADLLRCFQASCFIVLPFLAAWRVLKCCSIEDTQIMRQVTAILIVGAFVGILSLINAVTPELFRNMLAVYRRKQEAERAFTPLGGPSAVAMCLIMVYCLATGQLFSMRQRLMSVISLALCFAGILVTLSRAALVAFIIANIYLYGRHARGLARRLILLVLTTTIVLLPVGYWIGQRYSLERYTEGWMTGSSASINLRIESLKTAVLYGIHHFPFGGGWGLVYYPAREIGDKQLREKILYFDEGLSASKPHSLFALVFAESGIFALMLLLLFFWKLWRYMKPPDINAHFYGHNIVHGFRAGLLSFILLSMVQDHLFFTSKISFFVYLFIFLGVGASMYYNAVIVNHGKITDMIPQAQSLPSNSHTTHTAKPG